MNIDEILDSLQKKISEFEDLKRQITDLQEETRELIRIANTWFCDHLNELPEYTDMEVDED